MGYPRSQAEGVAAFVRQHYDRDAIGPQLWGGDGDGGSGGGGGEGGMTNGGGGAAEVGDAAEGGGAAEDEGVSNGCGRALLHEVLAAVRARAAAVQAASGSGAAAAAPAAGASEEAASAGPGVKQQLVALEAAMGAALDQACETVSPTIGVASSIELGPASTAAEDASAAGTAPLPVALAYLGPGAAGAAAAVCCGDQVFVVRGGSAGGETSSDGGSGGRDGQRSEQPEAALLQLPPGCRALDAAWYHGHPSRAGAADDGRLALLLRSSGDGGDGASLAMLTLEQLAFTPLPAELLAGAGSGAGISSSALEAARQVLGAAGAVTELPEEAAGGEEGGLRHRRLPHEGVHRPLAVSGRRGVGCVLAAQQVRGVQGALLRRTRILLGVTAPATCMAGPWDDHLLPTTPVCADASSWCPASLPALMHCCLAAPLLPARDAAGSRVR